MTSKWHTNDNKWHLFLQVWTQRWFSSGKLFEILCLPLVTLLPRSPTWSPTRHPIAEGSCFKKSWVSPMQVSKPLLSESASGLLKLNIIEWSLETLELFQAAKSKSAQECLPSQDKFSHASFGCTCQKGPGSLQTAAMDFYTSLWSPNKCSVALSPTWILKQPLEVFTGPHPHWQGIYLQKEHVSPSLSLARKYAFVDRIFDKSAAIKHWFELDPIIPKLEDSLPSFNSHTQSLSNIVACVTQSPNKKHHSDPLSPCNDKNLIVQT